MEKFKTLATSRVTVLIGGAVLALLLAWPFVGSAQDKSGKAKDPDPHADHKDKDKQPPGDQTLASQVSELRAKVTKLEAALEKSHPAKSSDISGMGDKKKGMEGMSGMGDKKKGMEGDKMAGGMGDKKKGMEGMSGMGMMDMDKKKGMGAMGGDKSGMMDQQMMQMMQMMQQMMEMKMMEMKMMGKGMESDMPAMKGMEMKAKGMGMGMKGMEMMGGKGMAGMKTPAALPAFPGASRIYHIGSTGFFLDHSEHIKLTTEQQTALTQAKEKGMLEQSSFQGKIDAAEQEMGTLTSSDKPDVSQIDAKVHAIEKLRGDQRLAFIRAIGEAGKVLNDEQRKSLSGTGTTKADPHAGHQP